MKWCLSRRGVKGRRERSSLEIPLPRLVHQLRPVFVVPQRPSSDAFREFPWVRLHMVAHEQCMVKIYIRVIAAEKSVRDIGFVGDGKIQAEDARVMDLLIDTEATRTAVLVERHRQLHTGDAGEQEGRPAV